MERYAYVVKNTSDNTFEVMSVASDEDEQFVQDCVKSGEIEVITKCKSTFEADKYINSKKLPRAYSDTTKRNIFADLKSHCKTKSQRLAFNELIKSFATNTSKFTKISQYLDLEEYFDWYDDPQEQIDATRKAYEIAAKALKCTLKDLIIFTDPGIEPCIIPGLLEVGDEQEKWINVAGDTKSDKCIYLDKKHELRVDLTETTKGFKYCRISQDIYSNGPEYYVCNPKSLTKEMLALATM